MIFAIVFDIILIIFLLIYYLKSKRTKKGEIQFIEPFDIYKRSLLFVGLILGLIFVLIISSLDFIAEYLEKSILVVLVYIFVITLLCLLWIDSFFCRRLIVTSEGIGYLDLFKNITFFTPWEKIENFKIEGSKLTLYVLGLRKKKIYYFDISKQEKKQLENIILKNIKSFI
ncbi:hypothetical protein [Caloranaerobacter ferrireducens]|uniref:hypothetical protein n=1 Tax=Caloranaerobacter ferrireducens TaxID=1323370 RepID=UPI00084DE00E|nr:hypothetical protein [Caloranaerobacter ferrireducens]